jgi:hypothetical protein
MHGSCLCGAVEFEVAGQTRAVIACHCSQCRRVSGHFVAASSAPLTAIRMICGDGLRWFRSSDTARRGFCGTCGANLFWAPSGEGRWSFSPGAIDGPTRLHVAEHIFTEDAGDYYMPEGPPPAPVAMTGRLHCACLCGAARFSLPGPAGDITACHCTQCRKLSGHYAASFDADEAAVDWGAQGTVREYQTAGYGRRGFCGDCGSSLYFRAADGAFSVEAGVVTGATGGRLTSHIFVADKGDYYSLTDGLPQFPGGSGA